MKDSKDRREFMKTGLTAAGTAVLGSVLQACENRSVQAGEKVKLLSPEGEIVEVDVSEVRALSDITYSPREGEKNKKFVMVIDLARCKNARKCVSSCNKMHSIKGPNEWLKIYKMQDSEEAAPYWQPTLCQHCDQPPCVKVCPVEATFKRRDGIVLIDNDRCIGCRFCMAACPYSSRVFNWGEPAQEMEVKEVHYMPETSVPAQMGTVEKCDFCPDSAARGELPHCVAACPNNVFYFGDIYEDTVTNGSETVRFKEFIKKRAGYRLMEDLGTNPSVYYLPPSDRLYDFEEGLENYEEFKSDSTSEHSVHKEVI